MIKNTMSSQIAEVTAFLLSGGLYYFVGPKLTFICCFSLSIVGNIFMLIYWNNMSILPVFLIMAKFGISATFNMSYIAFVQLIPTRYNTTAFGLTNAVGRLLTFGSPIIAEQVYPIPEAACIIALSVAVIASMFLVV